MKKFILFLFIVFLAICTVFASTDNFNLIVNHSGEKENLTFYFMKLFVEDDYVSKSGDCTLVVAPTGETMLIDCGAPPAFKDVQKVLDGLKIKRLDYVLISHPHIDHLGGFPELANNYEIGKVLRSKVEYDSSQYYRAFVEACDEHNLEVQYVGEGDSFKLSEDVECNILWPEYPVVYPKNYPAKRTEFLNNESILLQLVYGESKALFGGDLYKAGEKKAIKKYGDLLKSDVIKANHHGSDTSNYTKWIKTVKPQVVVAIHGEKMYSKKVYKNYIKRGATFYNTHFNGTVKVQMDDNHNVTALPEFESLVEKNEY